MFQSQGCLEVGLALQIPASGGLQRHGCPTVQRPFLDPTLPGQIFAFPLFSLSICSNCWRIAAGIHFLFYKPLNS